MPRETNPLLSLLPVGGISHLISQPRLDPSLHRGPSPQRYWFQAMLLEFLLCSVFVALGWRVHNPTHLALACLYSALLFEIAVVDFHYRLVLNILSYPTGAVAMLGSYLWSGFEIRGVGLALLGGVLALLIFFVIEIAGRGAMGRGDTKLAAVIGLMRGFPAFWVAIIAGVAVGGVMALALLLSGKGRRSTFAYGPSLAIGAIISFLVGRG